MQKDQADNHMAIVSWHCCLGPRDPIHRQQRAVNPPSNDEMAPITTHRPSIRVQCPPETTSMIIEIAKHNVDMPAFHAPKQSLSSRNANAHPGGRKANNDPYLRNAAKQLPHLFSCAVNSIFPYIMLQVKYDKPSSAADVVPSRT